MHKDDASVGRDEMGSKKTSGNRRIRCRIEIQGRVQGVGFRPYVYRLAATMSLTGRVGNDHRGVFIEVEGPESSLTAFQDRLVSELPPLARISRLAVERLPVLGDETFEIAESEGALRPEAEITPDTATCQDCLQELFRPDDRRHRYAFTNCTHCGPRYSIIRGVPYDRSRTTMSSFEMCAECRAEYEDPDDRRFHAQPNACPACGPQVRLVDGRGGAVAGDPVLACADLLRSGKIVAVKGLGGFHLACRADRDGPVRELRKRKGREARPFAMMMGSPAKARAVVHLGKNGEAALTHPARPIVLLPKREGAEISDAVAPNSTCFGIMLPYTPLHALLLHEDPGPLVMTSGNPSAEPLCYRNEEALERLQGMADAFLLHDRDIEHPVDDSVLGTMPLPGGDWVMPLRRARGYVPDPIAIDPPAEAPVLAVGGELKSVVCLAEGNRAVLSEHLGELTHPAAYRNFLKAVERFKALLEIEPECVACDLHPDYAATRFARATGLPRIEVQHHHAHIVSLMAEHGIRDPVIGVACDGTGFGADGTIWGCEVLIAGLSEFSRAGHLDPFPLLGGDAAALETWRPAAGLLFETFGSSWTEEAADLLGPIEPDAVTAAVRRLPGLEGAALTSSLGRLFDGVAFLLGICRCNRYEAEAPMALEAAASTAPGTGGPLPFALKEDPDGGAIRIDYRPMIRALVDELKGGRPAAVLARAFHETLAEALAACVQCVAARGEGLDRAALSGGCFANGILLGSLAERLEKMGIQVLLHRRVPPGDGGIALGQALVAAARIQEGAR